MRWAIRVDGVGWYVRDKESDAGLLEVGPDQIPILGDDALLANGEAGGRVHLVVARQSVVGGRFRGRPQLADHTPHDPHVDFTIHPLIRSNKNTDCQIESCLNYVKQVDRLAPSAGKEN